MDAVNHRLQSFKQRCVKTIFNMPLISSLESECFNMRQTDVLLQQIFEVFRTLGRRQLSWKIT